MGSDMRFYGQMVMERSHSGLIAALKKARFQLLMDGHPEKEGLIKEIDQALANASIG